MEYEKVIEMYPFIEKDFYSYKESTNHIIKMRNKYNKSIFCNLCYLKTIDKKIFIDYVIFLKKHYLRHKK